MQTHLLRVSDASGQLEELRAELMIFTDVLEVFSTGRADTLMVVCSGRPHPAEWVRALRAAGYTIPARHRAGSGSRGPRARVAELSRATRTPLPPEDSRPTVAVQPARPGCVGNNYYAA